jgi:hypothetical protein
MPGFFNETVLDLSELQVELASIKAKLKKSQELMPAIEEQISKPFPRADELAELSHDVTERVFDVCVNVGLEHGAGWFQEALNLLNRSQKLYRDLLTNEVIGHYYRRQV